MSSVSKETKMIDSSLNNEETIKMLALNSEPL